MPRRAVFLDRDDTLIRNSGHAPKGDLGDPALVELLPGAHDACTLLTANGYALYVVTNQGGVARGRFTEDDVLDVHARLNTLLDGMISDFRYCPFHPDGLLPEYTQEHPWRKPHPGMLLDLAEEHALDLSASWMVGDAVRDCEAGHAAGCRTLLITDDWVEPHASKHVHHTVADVLDAARRIIAHDLREVTTITLAARTGALDNERVRASVVAAARALAERNGVYILSVRTEDDTLVAQIEGPEIVGVGFASELRRTTDTWHHERAGAPLWKGPASV